MDSAQNEIAKINTNLLELFDNNQIKFREIDKKIDLFIPHLDLFIFLNKKETSTFKKILQKKSNLNSKETSNFLINFNNQIYKKN